MKRFPKAMKALILLIVLLTAASFTACNKKATSTSDGRTKKPANLKEVLVEPTDNDEEGWFSIEVLSQYSASSLTIPDGAEVTDKPERDLLYLKGGDTLLRDTATMVFNTINAVNDKVALPVYTLGEDGIAKVTSFEPIYSYTGEELLPDGEEDDVTFVYKSGHKYYECKVGNHTDTQGNKLVYIDFTDRTEEYKSIFNKD